MWPWLTMAEWNLQRYVKSAFCAAAKSSCMQRTSRTYGCHPGAATEWICRWDAMAWSRSRTATHWCSSPSASRRESGVSLERIYKRSSAIRPCLRADRILIELLRSASMQELPFLTSSTTAWRWVSSQLPRPSSLATSTKCRQAEPRPSSRRPRWLRREMWWTIAGQCAYARTPSPMRLDLHPESRKQRCRNKPKKGWRARWRVRSTSSPILLVKVRGLSYGIENWRLNRASNTV